MTADELEALFLKHDDACFLKDGEQRHRRKDIAAFLLLDELCPDTSDMVCHAEHDVICLAVDLEELAASPVTEAQIQELLRCGVHISDGYLQMFV